MAWRVADSLKVYIAQIDAAAPGRARASDGTIGDAAHQAGTSDHNPRLIAGLGATPVVTAADITHDPAHGCDCGVIAEQLRASRDPRIKYVIWSRRIFTSYPVGGVPAWTWRSYSGDNPHTKHSHLSVIGDTRADDPRPWAITTPVEDDMFNDTDRVDARAAQGRVLALAKGTDTVSWGPLAGEPVWVVREIRTQGGLLGQLLAAAQADEVRDRAVLAALQALAAGGGPDVAPVMAAIGAVRDEARQHYAEAAAAVAAAEARAAAAEAHAEQLAVALAGAGQQLMQLAADTPHPAEQR